MRSGDIRASRRPAFSSEQRDFLAAIRLAWNERFALIGALAHGFYIDAPRPSEDLDLVIAVEKDDIPELMSRLPGFSRDERLEHRWYGPGEHRRRVRVDLIPASKIPTPAGYLEWSDGHRMSVAGLDLAIEHTTPRTIAGGIAVPVPPPCVLAFLKMLALLDRPEREKDAQDLLLLAERFLDDDDPRRWEPPLASSGVAHTEQRYFLIGYDLGRIAKPPHHAALETFCTRPPRPMQGALQRIADERGWEAHPMLEIVLAGFRTALTSAR